MSKEEQETMRCVSQQDFPREASTCVQGEKEQQDDFSMVLS